MRERQSERENERVSERVESESEIVRMRVTLRNRVKVLER